MAVNPAVNLPVNCFISRAPIASRAAARSGRILPAWSIFVFFVFVSSVFGAQDQSVSLYHDPVELVRKAVQNEIKASKGDVAHFMFRGTKTTPKGSTTRLYVETRDATAGMVIAIDGMPLTAEQRREEESRLEHFVTHPEELKKKHQKEHEDNDRTLRIMRALPDAFLYENAGQQTGGEGIGHSGEPLVKLKFRPNPQYQPPSRVEEVLTGMQGHVLVDPVHYRLAEIDGTLFKEVGFGWGILGHLDRGSRFIVQQEDVGESVWEISRMKLNFTGKILMFKGLSINSTEVYSDFKPVPQLTFAQGLDLLKKEEAAITAENCCQPAQSPKSK
jgi:hypothetical protein